MWVDCWKCPHCRRKRAQTWQFRLEQEQKVAYSSIFLTCTYRTAHLPLTKNGLPTIKTEDHQKFLKRLRTFLTRKHWDEKIRYYGVAEYGTQTKRPHMHYILFGLPDELTTAVFNQEKGIFEHPILTDLWSHGHTYSLPVNTAAIRYVSNYVQKSIKDGFKDKGDDRLKERAYISDGLGANWLTDRTMTFYRQNPVPYIIQQDGKKLPMSKYYYKKLYDDDMKAQIQDELEDYRNEIDIFNDIERFIAYRREQYRKAEIKALTTRLTL